MGFRVKGFKSTLTQIRKEPNMHSKPTNPTLNPKLYHQNPNEISFIYLNPKTSTVNSHKVGRPNSAGIPYTLLVRIEAIGFPTLGLLL